MNKIVVELHPEDRARLDAIITGLQRVGAPVCNELKAAAVELPLEGTAHLEPIAAPAPAPAADPAPVEPVTAPDPEPMSLAEFQKVVTVWLAANPAKKPQARQLVNRYAPSATEIPPEKRAEFLTALNAL